jgi:Mg-chelatase subunit ChlD
VRGAIDFVDLLGGYGLDEIDLTTLRFVGCSAYAGKLKVRPATTRTACEIVHELIDAVLNRDYQGRVEVLLEQAAAPTGEPVASDDAGDVRAGEEGETTVAGGGEQPAGEPEGPDEIPGLSRPGGGEAGESRSVPMVDRDQPSARGVRPAGPTRDHHLRDPEAVLRAARDLNLRPRTGTHQPGGASGLALQSAPWIAGRDGALDLGATIDEFVANAATLQQEDYRLLVREPHARHYVILVDHSGSMVGRKLAAAATMAAALALLSAAGRGRYAVLAFDDQITEIKPLDEEHDVEEVVERILRLPEGRATDLGKALAAARELAGELPDATDTILISDCMPTRGATTFPPLAQLTRQISSLYVCFIDELSPAIRIFGGDRQLDLYQWWARQWVGDDRLAEIRDPEEIERLVDLLSTESTQGP